MSRSLTSQDVLALLEEATQALPGTLRETSELRSVDGWDSMGMVMFMGLVNERVGVELTVYELRECGTPVDLARVIAERARA